MTTADPITIEMKHISILFPGVKALKEIDFLAETGKIQAVVGANGAGKSTLMKVLAGAYDHYTGDIWIQGEKIRIKTPKDAKRQGIQVVYQEVDTALVPYLTVGENILLDHLGNHMEKKIFVDFPYMHRRAKEVLQKLHVNLSTYRYASELTLAEKQMVLIARAICDQCRFLILDEPTAPLSHGETEELFRVVRALKEEQVGVIFISHRLPELFQICDEVTVMRDGEIVIKQEIGKITPKELIRYMLGRSFEESLPKRAGAAREKLLEVQHISDGKKVDNICLSLRKGEIVGLAGLVGAGKTELCRALFGVSEVAEGEIWIEGSKRKIKTPYEAVQQGLALIPEERRKEGIFVDESISVNISATNLENLSGRSGFLDFNLEKKLGRKVMEALGIKAPDENRKVGFLSGGNQQKVVIGKWMETDASIYLFDEPTKGVDVGAKGEIFQLIRKLADSKKGVLYASGEIGELLQITERIYVLYDGKIAKELQTDQTTEEEILFYATGGQ